MEEPPEIEHWKRISILGSGAFGVVSLWQHNLTDEYIAIKKCKFRTSTHLSDRQKRRWENEVQIMRNLKCANIVSYKPLPAHLEAVLMKHNPTKLPLLSMEYCMKGNLRHVLTQIKNLSGLQEQEVRVVLSDLTRAVAYLHQNSITHRDIKPENIVLQESARPNGIIYKLIDLGYAKELGDSVVSFVGTLHYLAPEIMKTENYNYSVDYWSLGVVVFEVICGVLPFLPHFTPVERFPFIEKKKPEHICIYQLHSGSVAYSSELLKENHISIGLKQNIEVWLRHVLQYDPTLRGSHFPNNINVFDYLLNILAKKFVNVFSIYTLEFYSYEINESTLISTLKDWIARDTKVQKSEQVLLSNLESFEISDDRYVIDILPENDSNLYVFKKGVFINKETFKLPKSVILLFENCTKKYKWRDLRQFYIKVLFFLNQEEKLMNFIKVAFKLSTRYINHLNNQLKISMQQIHKSLSNQLIRIDCYYNLHSCGKPTSHNQTYKKLLQKSQQLMVDLEKCVNNGNDLNKKVEILLKRQEILDRVLPNVTPVINNCSVINEITRASEVFSKLNNEDSTPRDMVKIISSALKEKDKLLNNKNFRNYSKAVLIAIKEVDSLQIWMNHFQKHINQLSKEIDQNQKEQHQFLLSLVETKKKNGPVDDNLVQWDTDLIIKENQDLRCQLEEIIGYLFVSTKFLNESSPNF